MLEKKSLKNNIDFSEEKIIHLTMRGNKKNFPKRDDPNFYLGGWASVQAIGLAKFSSKIKQEIWRPEHEIFYPRQFRSNGVISRLFPFKKISKKLYINPLNLLLELYRECKNNRIVIDLHYVHNLSSLIIVLLFQKFPLVVHHHGNIPYRYNNKKRGIKRLYRKIMCYIEELLLRKVDFFSVISKAERNYLVEVIKTKNVELEQGRKYYNQWGPIAKNKARLNLGLSPDQKIIIYVGRFFKLKGVDILLQVFKKLKEEFDLSLILIGGSSEDELYEDVAKSGALFFKYLPNHKLIEYYSASDVYVLYSETDIVQWGGLGTAIIEAMACNIPVVSSQLRHFPNNDWRYVGETPSNQNQLYYSIKKVLEHPEFYSPREISKKYYDFELVLERNLRIYSNLLKNGKNSK